MLFNSQWMKTPMAKSMRPAGKAPASPHGEKLQSKMSEKILLQYHK
jgi:hypothetical protein